MQYSAGYVIDLGPEDSDEGGTLVGVGTPEHIAKLPASHTGHYLGPVLADERAHGRMSAEHKAHMAEIERENRGVLDALAASDRVPVEA